MKKRERIRKKARRIAANQFLKAMKRHNERTLRLRKRLVSAYPSYQATQAIERIHAISMLRDLYGICDENDKTFHQSMAERMLAIVSAHDFLINMVSRGPYSISGKVVTNEEASKGGEETGDHPSEQASEEGQTHRRDIT